MRKLLVSAAAAAALLATVGVAVAQTPTVFDATLSPAKVGTSERPKSHSLRAQLTVEKPGTTVGVIELTLSRGLKFSGKGFARCDKNVLIQGGPTACPAGSKAGPMGHALAAVEPANTPLELDIYPFVGNASTFYIYVDTTPYGLAIQDVLTGAISNRGRKLTITIPQALRQPIEGLDATLKTIDQTFAGKSGRRAIVSSTTCIKRRFVIGGKLIFSQRVDGNVPPAPESLTERVRCSR